MPSACSRIMTRETLVSSTVRTSGEHASEVSLPSAKSRARASTCATRDRSA